MKKNKVLISHEIPKALFNSHDKVSDYPYVLGHLISLDEEYKSFYKEKLSKSRFSIFDNSCFELGKSIPSIDLYNLAVEFKPTHLVLPDTLHNYEETVKASIEFYSTYKQKLFLQYNITPVAVLQGESFKELLQCFENYLASGLRFIAIPFDCIRDSDWHNIRYLFFKELQKHPRFKECNYHFLGLQNPSELLLYTEEDWELVNSIDTSSPVINGWIGNEYGDYGLSTPKPKLKLAENLDVELTENQVSLIFKNIKKFKSFIYGK
jgi:hypothetical protein